MCWVREWASVLRVQFADTRAVVFGSETAGVADVVANETHSAPMVASVVRVSGARLDAALSVW